jgi:TRAP transporter TAXI family solute receptor
MRKRFVVAAMVLVVWVFVLGHTATAQSTLPKTISISTNPIGSTLHTMGVALAKVVTDHTPMRVLVKPMSGAVAWYPYVQRGEIEMGDLNMWDAQKGYMGESLYDKLSGGKGFSVRLLCNAVPNMAGLMVAKDSPIKTIPELRGKRVAGNLPTPGTQIQTEAFLINGNLTYKDVIPVPANSPPDGVKLVMDGRADASCTIALGTPIINELEAKKGARYLPMDPSPEAVARMRKLFPGYMTKVSPGPGNVGVTQETYLWTYDMYIIVGETVSDDVVYTITKALWENYKELEQVHKEFKNWRPQTFVSKLATVPYHNGAIKFYKEKGAWDAEMDRIQKTLIEEKAAKQKK